jgi:hypothetical protein
MDPLEPTELALLESSTPPAPAKSRGRRIGTGLTMSLLAWFLVDQVLTWVSIWVFLGLLGIGFVFVFRAGGQRFKQLQIAALTIACVLGWMLFIYLFSLFKIWMLILFTGILAGFVFYKDRQIKQRQLWLNNGCCGQCGYDLRGTPDRCPECGRDTSLDEPTWRKLRRDWGNIRPADEAPLPGNPIPQQSPPTTVEDATSQITDL